MPCHVRDSAQKLKMSFYTEKLWETSRTSGMQKRVSSERPFILLKVRVALTVLVYTVYTVIFTLLTRKANLTKPCFKCKNKKVYRTFLLPECIRLLNCCSVVLMKSNSNLTSCQVRTIQLDFQLIH